MSSPTSDPLLLFTPPTSSSPGGPPPTTDSSVASTKFTMTSKTRSKASFFIEPPVLSESQRKQYKPVPEEFKEGVTFDRDDIDSVVGEYHDGTDLSYFVRFKDGLAYRLPASDFQAEYAELVEEYDRKKGAGELGEFDPSSSAVHEDSRIRTIVTINMVNGVARSTRAWGYTSSLASLSDLTEPSESDQQEDDDRSEDEYRQDRSMPTRKANSRPIRAAAKGKSTSRATTQTKLPFSPKKLRSRHVRRYMTESEDELAGYEQEDIIDVIPARRSARERKSARTNLAEDYVEDTGDSESDGESYMETSKRAGKSRAAAKTQKRLKRGPVSRPAYGIFRSVADLEFDAYEEDTELLRSHRDICEKCHKAPAHVQLEKPKKGRKKIRKDEDHGFEESEDDLIQPLGGWVRCLKCPVAVHWRCLAKTQKDEITRAARARDKEEWKSQQPDGYDGHEPPDSELPNRKELSIMQTTEFICANCMKGGICMGCKEIALEADSSITRRSTAPRAVSEPKPAGLTRDVEMVDATQTSSNAVDSVSSPARELVYRCFTCKRLAHYRHLPTPDTFEPDNPASVDDIKLASFYQFETGWRCADCFSYEYTVDKILAWRPYPANAVEPQYSSSNSPDPKSMLPREYLVKWNERSYRRTQWVPHMWLASTTYTKLKNFIATGPKVELLDNPAAEQNVMQVDSFAKEIPAQPVSFEVNASQTPEVEAKPKSVSSLSPLPDAERYIPPAWKTTDRVLDVLFWTVNRSGRGKKAKRNSAMESDEELEFPLELQDQLVKVQLKGEQPSDDCMETVDDFLRTVDKSELDTKDIKYVAWAFIKWDDLGYNEATWDSPPRSDEPGYLAFEAAFERFIDSQSVFVRKSDKDVKKLESRVKDGYAQHALRQKRQPKLGQNSQLQLMPFQMDGFDWLCDNWWNLQPCILADEMGLGKTVQIVTFLGTIIDKWQGAPALVVVPNSTITNWVREFTRWAPKLRVVPFYGEAKARDVIIEYELFHPSDRKGGPEPKYHVLVTTYETLINPRDFNSVFKSIPRWEVLVVDEGQRLKSDHSLLFKKLNELHTIHRVIMTGTPLNNNIRELFNLMNFLDPEEWSDLEALEKEHEELNEELVRQLHIRLKPYFLRRIKSEVLQLPPKNEVIVPLSMAPLQKEIYRSILSQNLDILRSLTQAATTKAGKTLVSKANLNNMLMQLRKCLQHPYLNSEDIEPRNLTPAEAHERLIGASTKLRFLKMLLPKLKARGHRILLFSQFVMALDIIEDFVRGEGYKFLRLDGNTKQADRQKGMDEFNKPNSDVFIYMLSTRAGGVGINLYTADTVIIFDPDFNPHQAIARSHRYGQTKTCLVFKFMVKDSAEERIMSMGKKKLVLDHLIVQKMDDGDGAGEDLQSILTFGAKALFEEGDESSKDIAYIDNDVEKLIEKTELEGDQQAATKEAGLSFAFAKVWAADKDTMEEIQEDVPDPEQGDSWALALERIAAAKGAEQVTEVTGRGARRKAAAIFPQQKLDHIEGLEDTPDTSRKKKKHRSSKSDASSDSDAYPGTPGAQTTDSGTSSMDMDMVNELLTTSDKVKMKAKARVKYREQASVKEDEDNLLCGLCNTRHGKGICYMTEDSTNLVEYREILMSHESDEPWAVRAAAIDAIEKTLGKRGHGHLLAGQPLKLVANGNSNQVYVKQKKEHARGSLDVQKPKTVSSSKPSTSSSAAPLESSSAKPFIVSSFRLSRPAGEAKKAGRQTALESSITDEDREREGRTVEPLALPSKRRPSPVPVAESSSAKKHKLSTTQCPVCGGPYHHMEDCPVVALGPRSITAHILRLEQDPSQQATVHSLQKQLRRQRRKQDAEEAARYSAFGGPSMLGQ
ncbi:SNF2 family N-terminal domain-containing protein [Suillus subaureus]|uniref:SNF2 family N-terminal domain-containing protein n=1 Tax=Suillus subaureus TaxID=48587 RepID=A0A9P7EMW0_9AGAM|nr:SNF2 family N-terminal domain-containing protein [Suillus subaureus]KAG1825750.1 SNF2 family N-terminal domain-containing protein [Suillus subaureus]